MTDSPNTTPPADSEPSIDVQVDATRCQSWAAGHRVHWVQGLRAANSSAPFATPTITSIHVMRLINFSL